MGRDKDFDAAIARELAAAGIKSYRIEPGGKHPRLVFEHQGQTRRYVLPSSPSDHRARLNMVHDLRGILGTSTAARSAGPAPPPPVVIDPAWSVMARARVTANPPSQPTERDRQVASLLDHDFAAPEDLARRASAVDPGGWVRSHLERLERLVALGLAERDEGGRYRAVPDGGKIRS